jgi:SAM-dependent methyltransferase
MAQLALSGFLALFLELSLIRWVPAQVRVLAYFTNFVLLGAFLGLGVGLLLRAKERVAAAFPLVLFLTVNAFAWMRSANFDVRLGKGFYVWEFLRSGRPQVNLPVVLVVGFLLVVIPFVPIGVVMGRAFRRASRLPGYAWNVAGSLAGILAFAGLSAMGAAPWIWFLVAAAAALALVPAPSRRWRFAGATLLTLVVVLVWLGERPFMWSPYYQIGLHPRPGTQDRQWELKVNNDYHQLLLDLSDEGVAESPALAGWRRLYDAPYAATHPRRVLIVGAGTGNDVAAALRAGVEHVDAVEIDPMILRIGRKLHPQHPYSDPRVTPHCTDARAFLRQSREQYDLIVFAFVDSHTLLSSLSSVRLDSYVYTVESLQDARRLLGPHGAVTLTFSVEQDWIGQRLYGMMAEAFGERPVVNQEPGTNGTIYMAGPGIDRAAVTDNPGVYAGGDVRLATDDWPFLYFQRPHLPPEYVLVLGIVAVLSFLAVGASCWRAAVRPPLAPFALGAGFMLLETRGVTVIALLLGSTWITNVLVFTVILTLSLLATIWTARHRGSQDSPWVGVLLLLSIVVVAIFPMHAMAGLPGGARLLAAAVPMLPVLFAGVLFARVFARAADPDIALGSNLLGAVAGGLCEYAALMIGFARLLWIAAALYAIAIVAWRLQVRRAPAAIP